MKDVLNGLFTLTEAWEQEPIMGYDSIARFAASVDGLASGADLDRLMTANGLNHRSHGARKVQQVTALVHHCLGLLK